MFGGGSIGLSYEVTHGAEWGDYHQNMKLLTPFLHIAYAEKAIGRKEASLFLIDAACSVLKIASAPEMTLI